MVDLLVTLWDGKEGGFKKETKFSDSDTVENPWINIIACTTPAWISGNFPDYMIGGGFTSRCIFVYAEKKEKYSAYPALAAPQNLGDTRSKLIADLESISKDLVGEYKLTAEAITWGTQWYQDNYEKDSDLCPSQFGGYRARKQSHIHKLAMILAASSTTEMSISLDHLQTANAMVTDLEQDMQHVFSKIGRNENADSSDKIIAYVEKRKAVEYQELYRYVYAFFPNIRDFENILAGCVKSGMINLKQNGKSIILSPGKFLKNNPTEKKTQLEGRKEVVHATNI